MSHLLYPKFVILNPVSVVRPTLVRLLPDRHCDTSAAVRPGEAVYFILSTPSFRENARQRLAALASIDGAANAADEVEALLELQASAAPNRELRNEPRAQRQHLA